MGDQATHVFVRTAAGFAAILVTVGCVAPESPPRSEAAELSSISNSLTEAEGGGQHVQCGLQRRRNRAAGGTAL
jgi:hypothetical protein